MQSQENSINKSTTATETYDQEQNLKVDVVQDNVRNLAFYNRELTRVLPKHIFERNPARLGYGVMFLTGNALLIWAVMTMNLHWSLKILAGFIIGQFNGGMAFLAHETLHGSVVKNKWLQDFIGYLGFGPFTVSPTYWRFWHNRLHHGNTQFILKDPDAFPTLGVYRRSNFMQKLFDWTPGAGTIRSYSYFFFWFSFQAFLNQIYMRFGNKMWAQMENKRVSVEFGSQVVLACLYLNFIGLENLLYLAVIPFMIQNYTVMSYISTNHNISPLTKINDPLANSLTVTTNPVFDFFHMNFGYHVEHHIFPRMSCTHSKMVHQEIKRMYPETFQVMKKSEALKLLYKTPRIYKSADELIHPKTLKIYPTIPWK
jgi:fatty acid desaturase